MNKFSSYNSKLLLFVSFFLWTNISFLEGQQKTVSELPKGSRNGMAATAHPLATETANEILKMGGNAVDAAVGAAFTIGVVEPDGSGIGGGGSMVIYLAKEKKSYSINYYPRASEKVKELNYVLEKDRRSVRAITIPSNVAGLIKALEEFGTLPLRTVIAPAIKYAEEGFPVDGTLGSIILDNTELLQKYSSTSEIFLKDGFPLMEGDILYQKELAKTLRTISEKGRAGFYEGEIAAKMVDDILKAGGLITLNDFKNCEATIEEPVVGSYRGYDIYSAGNPQSGISIIEAMNILEKKDLKSMGHFSASGESAHFLAETLRRVYADRTAFVGDPNFVSVPSAGLLSKDYAQSRFNDIDQNVANPPEYRKTKAGNPFGFLPVQDQNKTKTSKDESEGGHTTHLSIIDKDGNMVSLTQTLGTFFGSGFVSEGVLFNCGMSNFSETMKINIPEPNKQPRSSITPTIILKDGKPFAVVGSPGATRIIATVVQIISNIIDFGMSADEANKAPRMFCQKFDDFLHVEGRYSPEVIETLKKKGHNVRVYGDFDLFFGGAQLIIIDPITGMAFGSADVRRGGTAKGLDEN